MLVTAACGGGAGGDTDAGSPDDVGVERPDGIVRPDAGTPTFVPTEPAPPEIPWLDSGPLGPVSLPVLTPCPAGWREIPPADALSPAVCDPWPESGMREDCADDEAHFPGEPDCVRIGPQCPIGDWADDLPADSRIVYVRAGESAGGDGTRDRPFGRIDAALAAAIDGDVIALSKGRFDEAVRLDSRLDLRGACARETVLGSLDAGSPSIVVVGAEADVRHLRVEGAGPGIAVLEGASARIEGVAVAPLTGYGIEVEGARASASEVVVRVRGETAEPAPGAVASGGGVLELERVAVLHSRVWGIRAADEGTLVTLGDCVLHDLGTAPNFGLTAVGGARSEVERTAVEGYRSADVYADGDGLGTSTVHLQDSVIRGSGGLRTQSMSGVDLLRVRFVGDGLFMQGGPGDPEGDLLSWIEGSHVVIEDAALAIGATIGSGVVELSHVLVDGAEAGVLARGSGTARVRDAVIRDVVGPVLEAAEVGTTVELTDVSMLRSTGMQVEEGAGLFLSRVVLAESSGTVLFVSGDASAELADVVIRGTDSGEAGLYGSGIYAESGSRLRAERLAVSDCRGVGVAAFGNATTLDLVDAHVASTAERGCVSTSCLGLGFGIGVGAYDGAAIELSRFAITDNLFGGLQLANDGTIDLHDGRVSGHDVGANVQTTGFDVNRIFDRVLFVDNGIDVDGSLLALPDAPGGS